MRTSDQRMPLPMRPAWDAIGLAIAFALVPEWAMARAGIVLAPHPGWVAVLVVSARHGSGGFLRGILATAVAVGVGSAIGGVGFGSWPRRLDSGPDLIALGACVLVSWVASWHVRREEELRERLRVVTDQMTQSDATVAALRVVVSTLRARVDRTFTSLSFLRDAAARLEGTDPIAAAEAAADLALARTGACAAAVRAGTNGTQRLLAVRDARGHSDLAPLELRDVQLSVPILAGREQVGDIALWGMPGSNFDAPMTHDLEVIASWCMPSMSRARWLPEETTDREWRVL